MITVNVKNNAQQLCLIRIEPQEFDEEVIKYTAEFVVERGGAIGMHRRVFDVPNQSTNILL